MSFDSKKTVLYTSSALLAALVISGFALVGTPGKGRAMLEDKQKNIAMSCMACFAQQYACEHEGSFPENQQVLVDYLNNNNHTGKYCNASGLNCSSWQLAPQEKFDNYRYEAQGSESYTMCATLAFRANDGVYNNAENLPEELKDYKNGEQCFTFKPRSCPKKIERVK